MNNNNDSENNYCILSIRVRLLELDNRLDRHNQYIDNFCGSINDLSQKIKELENKFKMRGDRLEDIEQAIANLESNLNNFYNSLKYLSTSLDDCIEQDGFYSLRTDMFKIQEDLKTTKAVVKLLAQQNQEDTD